MKSIELFNRILKAALLLLLTAGLSFGQGSLMKNAKKKSIKRVYHCKHVGSQKISNKRFSKKETAEYIASNKRTRLVKIEDTTKVTSEYSETSFIAEVKKVEEEMVRETNLPLPQPVYFKFDKDELTYHDLHQIVLAVEHARQGKSIIIEGHTDSHGNNDYNMTLSLKRANRIKAMMVEMGGVNSEAISIKNYGEEKPAVANDCDENRQLNRRVEFIVLQY